MKKKLQKFFEVLEGNGDYYFSLGSIKKDFEYISTVIKQQGYWSGIKERYYFDNDFNLVRIENRF